MKPEALAVRKLLGSIVRRVDAIKALILPYEMNLERVFDFENPMFTWIVTNYAHKCNRILRQTQDTLSPGMKLSVSL